MVTPVSILTLPARVTASTRPWTTGAVAVPLATKMWQIICQTSTGIDVTTPVTGSQSATIVFRLIVVPRTGLGLVIGVPHVRARQMSRRIAIQDTRIPSKDFVNRIRPLGGCDR
jgi:hypothetical protein